MRTKITSAALNRYALLGSVLAGVGASVCCLGPLVLLTLGISGAWIAHLAAFERFRPEFTVLALALIALAGWRLFAADRGCAPGSACARSPAQRWQRLTFWIVVPLVLLLLASPWLLPLILR